MSKLLTVSKVLLPSICVREIYTHLRTCGKEKMEGVGLIAGVQHDHSFTVKTVIIPAQTGYRMEEGLLYSVEGDELHRINTWLYRNKMTLVAQVHSHPGEAYHSDTDDRYPIIAAFGGISIVIPDFAFGPFQLNSWAVYRLSATEGWTGLSEKQVEELIQIT